jgi:hypothetical protein
LPCNLEDGFSPGPGSEDDKRIFNKNLKKILKKRFWLRFVRLWIRFL